MKGIWQDNVLVGNVLCKSQSLSCSLKMVGVPKSLELIRIFWHLLAETNGHYTLTNVVIHEVTSGHLCLRIN